MAGQANSASMPQAGEGQQRRQEEQQEERPKAPADTHNNRRPCAPDCICSGKGGAGHQEVGWDELSRVEYLARGAMCNIYKAKLGGRRVAVKLARGDIKDPKMAERDLEIEMHLLHHLKHRNIIELVGAGIRDEGGRRQRFLVVEYLELGTLADGVACGVVHGNYQTSIGKLMKGAKRLKHEHMVAMLQRGVELADALAHMHNMCGGAAAVLHRDLKPDNIAFANDGSLKLIDFGLARCKRRDAADGANGTYAMTGNTGTVRYMAPEVVCGKPYNESIDVYSFGLLLWEMLQYQRVFKGLELRDFYKQVVRGGRRPDMEEHWPPALQSLMSACWAARPESRPGMGLITQQLRDILAQVQEEGPSAASTGTSTLSISTDTPLDGSPQQVFARGTKSAKALTNEADRQRRLSLFRGSKSQRSSPERPQPHGSGGAATPQQQQHLSSGGAKTDGSAGERTPARARTRSKSARALVSKLELPGLMTRLPAASQLPHRLADAPAAEPPPLHQKPLRTSGASNGSGSRPRRLRSPPPPLRDGTPSPDFTPAKHWRGGGSAAVAAAVAPQRAPPCTVSAPPAGVSKAGMPDMRLLSVTDTASPRSTDSPGGAAQGRLGVLRRFASRFGSSRSGGMPR